MELSRIQNDLYWILTSPGLFAPDFLPVVGDDDFRAIIRGVLESNTEAFKLKQTEADAILQKPRVYKLGIYAEALVESILSKLKIGYELAASNLPVKKDGKHIGEFDFILKNKNTLTAEHWELSVKFYLLKKNATGLSADFIGPNGRDSFEIKLNKLRSRQLHLHETEEGAEALEEAGVRVDGMVSKLLTRGCLFYHAESWRSMAVPAFVSPEALRGWWCTVDEIERFLPKDELFVICERIEWMSPFEPGEASERILNRDQLITRLKEQFKTDESGVMIDVRGKSRGFVVHSRWPEMLSS